MKNLIQVAAVTLLAASTAQAQQAVQWKESDGGNGHWYQLRLAGPISWFDARIQAELLGGHLATLTSDPEKMFAQSVVAQTPGYGESAVRGWGPWLGGYQELGAPDYAEPAGGWRWITAEVWDYAAWPSYQPDNWCVESSLQEHFLSIAGAGLQANGAWNDLPSNGCDDDSVISYVVEWSADCNNDGIVDYGQILQGQLADLNTDGVPDICQQPTCVDADIFRDFNVNGADLGILLSQWGPNTPLTESDLNRDGAVDGLDLGILLSFWGPCP
jgi:hypothetical protein